jgi:hypothetical protein
MKSSGVILSHRLIAYMSLRIQNASEEELIAMIHAAGGGYGS